MRPPRSFTFPFRLALALPLLALLSVPVARADTLWIGGSSGNTGAIQIQGAKITGIENGNLVFQTREGRSATRELDRVQRIAVDAEPAVTAGEDALASERWDAAVDAYLRVVRAGPSTTKPWLADWASRRVQVAAARSGRFDAAVAAYVTRVQFDAPASLKRPELPDGRSTYLDTAAKDVDAALGNAKLSDEQRVALLSFLVDLHRARRDAKSADQSAEKLDELLAKDPTNPNAARAIARRKVQAAQAALEKKDYRQAVSEIESNRGLFSDPTQQADALFLLAEARFRALAPNGFAPGTRAPSNLEPELRDAALAYVRVVAHFKELPDRPHVTESLARVAQIHELLGDPQTAARVYQQLATTWPDDPQAAPARQAADRLRQQQPQPPTTAPKPTAR